MSPGLVEIATQTNALASADHSAEVDLCLPRQLETSHICVHPAKYWGTDLCHLTQKSVFTNGVHRCISRAERETERSRDLEHR